MRPFLVPVHLPSLSSFGDTLRHLRSTAPVSSEFYHWTLAYRCGFLMDRSTHSPPLHATVVVATAQQVWPDSGLMMPRLRACIGMTRADNFY